MRFCVLAVNELQRVTQYVKMDKCLARSCLRNDRSIFYNKPISGTIGTVCKQDATGITFIIRAIYIIQITLCASYIIQGASYTVRHTPFVPSPLFQIFLQCFKRRV